MDSFEDYYNISVDIANCSFGSIESKKNIQETILMMCFHFANEYEQDLKFRKEADTYIRYMKSKYYGR